MKTARVGVRNWAVCVFCVSLLAATLTVSFLGGLMRVYSLGYSEPLEFDLRNHPEFHHYFDYDFGIYALTTEGGGFLGGLPWAAIAISAAAFAMLFYVFLWPRIRGGGSLRDKPDRNIDNSAA